MPITVSPKWAREVMEMVLSLCMVVYPPPPPIKTLKKNRRSEVRDTEVFVFHPPSPFSLILRNEYTLANAYKTL